MPMRDSRLPDDWVRDMVARNPIARVLNADGSWSGLITSGPVRLAFCDALFEAKVPMANSPQQRANAKAVFSTAVLWTPYADLSILWEEFYRVCQSDFAAKYNPMTGEYMVDKALRDQAEKYNFSGFTQGAYFTNMSSQFKPPVVNERNQPIIDQSQIYAGCWAIVGFNVYASGKGTPRQGPRFGLAAVQKIADDDTLAGGAADPTQVFAQVNVRPPAGVLPPPPMGGMPLPGVMPGVAATYYPPAAGHMPHMPPPPAMPAHMPPAPGAMPPAPPSVPGVVPDWLKAMS